MDWYCYLPVQFRYSHAVTELGNHPAGTRYHDHTRVLYGRWRLIGGR